MKFRKSLFILFSLPILMFVLYGNANALEVVNVRWGHNTFPTKVTQLEIIDGNGKRTWVDVYDEQGNPLFVNVCEENGELGWEYIENAPSQESQAERTRVKKAEIEAQFGIKINFENQAGDSYAVKLNRLYDLERCINVIPQPLWEAARNRLSSQKRILKICFSPDFSSDDLFASADGIYDDAKTQIEVYYTHAETIFAHEYGHMLHALVKKQYGAEPLKSNWIAFNNGVKYGDDYAWSDYPEFCSFYGSNSYDEDFAETFAMVVDACEGIYSPHEMVDQFPGSPAVKKMFYMRWLLSDAFKLDTSVFTQFQSSEEVALNNSTNRFFTDVPGNAYYYQAVKWAKEVNIASGTSETTFSPNKQCSIAEIIVFLWRFRGCQEPAKANPFTDIESSDYFYKAALWAHENGLVEGKTFSPSTPCTRSMVMNYLWKLAGSPNSKHVDFSDVPAGSNDADAISWAVGKGITDGTGNGKFSPNKICTRGQIVTFLFRAI